MEYKEFKQAVKTAVETHDEHEMEHLKGLDGRWFEDAIEELEKSKVKARFNQETRDFIEGLFEHFNYDLEKQISYLEIRERQMYHYNMDCIGCVDESAWNEIIDMLNERKEKREA